MKTVLKSLAAAAARALPLGGAAGTSKTSPTSVRARKTWPAVSEYCRNGCGPINEPALKKGPFYAWLRGRYWGPFSDDGITHMLLANIEMGNHIDDYSCWEEHSSWKPDAFPPTTCLVSIVREEQIDRFGGEESWLSLAQFLVESGCSTTWTNEDGQSITIEELAELEWQGSGPLESFRSVIGAARAKRERALILDECRQPKAEPNQSQSRL